MYFDRRHPRRLEWLHPGVGPVYFVTTVVHERQPILACAESAAVVRDALKRARGADEWRVGRYVIMPDHVHLFCCPGEGRETLLSQFMQRFKSVSGFHLARTGRIASPCWQADFFDHVLRTGESYQQKWEYVRENPVRAGLVATWDAWPYQGEMDEVRW